ncbi:MAG: DUF2284 domain-containing protein [Clostridiales bacterium]
MIKYDLQQDDFDYLSEIAQGFGYGEILDIAVKKELFTILTNGIEEIKIPALIGYDEKATHLFLVTLSKLGLIGMGEGYIYNTPVSAKYLDKKSHFYLGENLLTRETPQLFLGEKLLAYFTSTSLKGTGKNATAMPLFNEIFTTEHKNLTFGQSENHSLILAEENYLEELKTLDNHGFLVIMGEFAEIDTAASSINALRRYCSGKKEKMPPIAQIIQELTAKNILTTPLIPLSTGFGVIIAAKNQEDLDSLAYTKEQRLIALLKCDKITDMKIIDVQDVVTADWVKDHCRFGCSSYGDKCCPPLSPTYEETAAKLSTYSQALLIEGEPPTADFQKLMLRNEKIAFKAGFYKAFAYWAGPCSICTECKMPKPPKKCTATRPSMESAGIDVFATVRAQGYTMETRKDKTEFVKYFGLLLLE